MNNPTGSNYILQNAILREMAKPASEGANVSLEKPVLNYAVGKSVTNADDVRFSQKLAQDEKQFLTELLSAHDKLSTWSKQNDLATLLAAATIPGQVMSMKKQSDSLDRQNEIYQQIIDSNKVSLAAATRAKGM